MLSFFKQKKEEKIGQSKYSFSTEDYDIESIKVRIVDKLNNVHVITMEGWIDEGDTYDYPHKATDVLQAKIHSSKNGLLELARGYWVDAVTVEIIETLPKLVTIRTGVRRPCYE